jgi:uncharacterized protein involved in exopolysaccharide biosynthesis
MTVAQLKKRMDGRFTRVEQLLRQMGPGLDEMRQGLGEMRQGLGEMRQGLGEMSRSHDARFASLERRLISLDDKLNSITKRLDDKIDHHWIAVNEHEDRLKDLEAAERARASAQH